VQAQETRDLTTLAAYGLRILVLPQIRKSVDTSTENVEERKEEEKSEKRARKEREKKNR
jgi:hypothetical protein